MTHTRYPALLLSPEQPWSAYWEGLLTGRQAEVNEKQSEQLPGW
jgi:hypothetical protein